MNKGKKKGRILAFSTCIYIVPGVLVSAIRQEEETKDKEF